LFPAGSTWRYTDDGVERGTAWKERPYDDTAWKTGNAQLGYGDGDEATVMYNGGTVPLQRWISHYLRRSFTVTNAAQVSGLTLSVLRDDGVVVYVNGTEVARDNMPTGTITSQTLALNAQFDAAETTFFDFAIPPALLVEGTNVIAVSVHNESRQGTGDLSFDARLVAQRPGSPGGDTTPPSTPANLRVTSRGATQVVLAWDAATDNVGVTGYVVTRNGVDLPVTTSTMLTDTLLAPGASYSYTVRARDAALNQSAPSSALPVTTHAPAETVVAQSSAWRYTDDGVERGTAWKERTYDDSTWKTGNAQLGYGDGDEATVMFNGGTVPLQRWISHYVRRSFTVTDVAALSGATVSVLRDDGVVIYVNGTEIARDNMPTGTITSQTLALNAQFDAAETTYFDFAIPPALLVEGTNVIAISVHNESRQGTGDLSFDARVTARYS
jgi:chitodextrinase